MLSLSSQVYDFDKWERDNSSADMKITLFEKETHDHGYNFDMDGDSPLDEDLLAPILYDKDLVLADSKKMEGFVTNSTETTRKIYQHCYLTHQEHPEI